MSKIIWIYLSHFKILVRSSFHGMHIYVHILETICFLKDAQFLTTHSKVSENQKPLRYLKLTFEQRSILPVDSCPQNSTTGVTLVFAHFWYLSGLDKLVSTMYVENWSSSRHVHAEQSTHFDQEQVHSVSFFQFFESQLIIFIKPRFDIFVVIYENLKKNQ